MAYIGLAHPVIAKLASQSTQAGVTTPTYSDAFLCGKAVSINVAPNYNEARLYADNILAEYAKEFKDGTITLGVDALPIEAQSVMFGHAVSGTQGQEEITYKSGDAGSYVGVGFYVDTIRQGKRAYEASVIYRCLFAQGADDYTTKGDSIEFKTPSLEGAVSALDDGQWKKSKVFATEADAQAWLHTELNLTA